MRYWLILLALICIPSFVEASDIYFASASAGANNGSSCVNARAASTHVVGDDLPGNTLHICGTLTGGSGATLWTFLASGTSGNTVTLKFESGAIVQASYCASGNGCINGNGKAFITIDGGTNGIVQATNNGSVAGGFGFQQSTVGINVSGGHDVEVKNLTVQHLYVRTSTTDVALNDTATQGVSFSGSNIKIHDNTFTDASEFVYDPSFGSGDDNTQIYNNNISKVNIGIIIAGGNVSAGSYYVHDNQYHDVQNWDDTTGANNYHHNFIHGFDCSSGAGPTAIYIYNNYLYGNPGGNSTAGVFLEGDGCQWSSSGRAYIWNNVGAMSTIPGLGYFSISGAVTFYSNTLIGSHDGTHGCMQFAGSTSIVEDNVMQGCAQIYASSGASGMTTMDFQTYAFASSGNPLLQVGSANSAGGFGSNLLTAFWTISSSPGCLFFFPSAVCDAHSSWSTTALANLNTTTGAISTGFVGIAAGTNLTSACTGALVSLCSDTTLGNTRVAQTRSASGNWDTGAYCFTNCGGGSVTLTPSPENFGPVPFGNSSLVSFTLTNNSSATVSGISPSVTGGNAGDFVVGNVGLGSCNAAGNTIAVGASCAVAVTFTPSVVGTRTATLSISYSGGDGASPQTSALTGQGTGQLCQKCFVRNDEKMEQRRGND